MHKKKAEGKALQRAPKTHQTYLHILLLTYRYVSHWVLYERRLLQCKILKHSCKGVFEKLQSNRILKLLIAPVLQVSLIIIIIIMKNKTVFTNESSESQYFTILSQRCLKFTNGGKCYDKNLPVYIYMAKKPQ